MRRRTAKFEVRCNNSTSTHEKTGRMWRVSWFKRWVRASSSSSQLLASFAGCTSPQSNFTATADHRDPRPDRWCAAASPTAAPAPHRPRPAHHTPALGEEKATGGLIS